MNLTEEDEHKISYESLGQVWYIYPSSLSLFLLKDTRVLEPVLAVTGWEAEYTLDRIPVHYRSAMYSLGQNFYPPPFWNHMIDVSIASKTTKKSHKVW